MRKSWVERYMGLQFADGGRYSPKVDCWGMVRLIYCEQLAIDLPEYGEISAADLVAVTREIDIGKDGEAWQSVEREALQEFDVCVMRYLGTRRIGHVGVITPFSTVLHIEQGINSVHVPLSHPTIKGRIACFRRHKKITR